MMDEKLTIIAYASVILFIIAIASGVAAGLSFVVSVAWNLLLALDIEYYKIPLSVASNPFIVMASIIDVIVFALLAVWLAGLFFEFIKGLSLREKIELRMISRLRKHVIITSMNTFGELIYKKLEDREIKSVFIVQNELELERAGNLKAPAIVGNSTAKESLAKAGISNAAYIVACNEDDIKNSMVAISAKAIEKKVRIITRVSEEENIPKLSRSGVFKCIMPEASAGNEMAESIIGAYS